MCSFVFVNFWEESASRESQKRFSCGRCGGGAEPQTGPPPPTPRTREPLGFCCALIEIGNFFPEERIRISVAGCGRRGAAAEHDETRQKLLLFVSSAEELSCSGV